MSETSHLAKEVKELVEAGEHTRAIRKLIQWTDTHPQDAIAWYLLAKIRYELGHYKPAKAAAERVVALCPSSAAAWCNLGKILRKLGYNKEAVQAQKHALELDPHLRQAQVELAKLQKPATSEKILLTVSDADNLSAYLPTSAPNQQIEQTYTASTHEAVLFKQSSVRPPTQSIVSLGLPRWAFLLTIILLLGILGMLGATLFTAYQKQSRRTAPSISIDFQRHPQGIPRTSNGSTARSLMPDNSKRPPNRPSAIRSSPENPQKSSQQFLYDNTQPSSP